MMWFNKWFNEDYLRLYSNRSFEEAQMQVHFIVKALGLKGTESVLDLACGTGRHSVAFGVLGNSVVGVDLSSVLINKAKERLRIIPSVPVQFLVADMFKLDELGQFDLVINLFTSFGYFDSDTANARIFEVVRKHLKPTGYFFLDYLHPYRVICNLVPEETRQVEGETVKIYRSIEQDCVIKRIVFPNREYREQVKLYTRDQIEEMLTRNGLSVVSAWNDYEGNPWKEKGDRQLFSCKLAL